MSLKLFHAPQWGPKGLLELYENIFQPVFNFWRDSWSTSGNQPAVSQNSDSPPPPPPLRGESMFFTSGTRAGDMGYTPPYFRDAECNRSTLFPPIDT